MGARGLAGAGAARPLTTPARGLSGDAARALPAAPGADLFERMLRRFALGSDLWAEPLALWESPGGGLRAHLDAPVPADLPPPAEILIVISAEDADRAPGTAALARARAVLDARVAAWRAARGLPAPDPPVNLVRDGGEGIGGLRLGLRPGEALTGLLPHRAGPGASAAWAVYVHFPGEAGWEERGRLGPGQGLATAGDHGLDTIRHPLFRHPAAWVLRRGPGGAWVHGTNPGLAGAVRVVPGRGPGGEPVVAVQDAAGAPIAWVAVAPLRATPDDPLAGLGALPRQAVDDPAPPPSPHLPAETIAPAVDDRRVLVLVEAGALLQRVHFPDRMAGYELQLGPRGEVASRLSGAPARLRVLPDALLLGAEAEDVTLDGEPVPPGGFRAIAGDAVVGLGAVALDVRDLRGVDAPGWPWVAEVRRRGGEIALPFGARHGIGRGAHHAVRLPDDGHADNILWREGAGASVPVKGGALARDAFATDRVFVATDHLELDLTGAPAVSSLTARCPAFVRRAGIALPVGPAREGVPAQGVGLEPDDELLVGNCLFTVHYAPASRPRPAAGDRGPLSAAALLAGVDFAPTRDALPPVARAPGAGDALPPAARAPGAGDALPPVAGALPPVARAPGPGEARASAGHGERGPAAGVRVVEPAELAQERSRSARLRLCTWVLAPGESVGNHAGHTVILPEVGALAPPAELLRCVAGPDGAPRLVPGPGVALGVGASGVATLHVVRGDVHAGLPHALALRPRAVDGQLHLELEPQDPVAAGLLLVGLPLRVPRTLRVPGAERVLRWDGAALRVDDADGAPIATLRPGEPWAVGPLRYRLEEG